MSLRITIHHTGAETVREFDLDRVLIGRLTRADGPGLDLSDDASASRQHALIEVREGACWLSDLGSSFGTTVNGQNIRGKGPQRVWPEDTVTVGETTLRIALLPGAQPASAQPGSRPEPDKSAVQITRAIDTTRSHLGPAVPATTPAEKRLALLVELPEQFGAQTHVDALLQLIMNRVVAVIPNARRGALLLRDPQQDTLLLKAYVSPDEPAVSETLARRALAEKRGLLWHSTGSGDSSHSVRQHQILHGMYAPLERQGEVYGVICVDSPVAADSFQEQDLEFLLAIARYAAMALSEQRLRTELERHLRLTDRLLANFSPKVRAKLVEQARQGKLRPGGTKSEITLLFCDLVGFTRRAAQMDAHDVVDMLNDYLGPAVQAVGRHGGTVDKFIGDALLAVFGSPEPDPHQHENAVRAAFALQEAVRATSQLRAARGDVTCQVRVGLHCGEVFHGFVGTVDRLEFTVIGDAVNRANRYCSAAGEDEIWISTEVFHRVFKWVSAEKVLAQTKEGELVAYRLTTLRT
jgi:adenylate cyclase